MVPTDAQLAARKHERAWARNLADKFDTTGRATENNLIKSELSSSEPAELELSALEATLRQISCASEFKHRKRPTWLYVTGCAVCLTMMTLILAAMLQTIQASRDLILAYLGLVGFTVCSWIVMWWRAVPTCPNCKQNIRYCPPEHCHIFGNSLNHKRCTECGVDHSWIGWFLPYRNGSFHWIEHCPGCGVELDTWIRRWRAGD